MLSSVARVDGRRDKKCSLKPRFSFREKLSCSKMVYRISFSIDEPSKFLFLRRLELESSRSMVLSSVTIRVTMGINLAGRFLSTNKVSENFSVWRETFCGRLCKLEARWAGDVSLLDPPKASNNTRLVSRLLFFSEIDTMQLIRD